MTKTNSQNVASYGFRITAGGQSTEVWFPPMAYAKARKAAADYAKEQGWRSAKIEIL